jgi:Undecaprenyl-phosphate galactose phosphotransferase WbaP
MVVVQGKNPTQSPVSRKNTRVQKSRPSFGYLRQTLLTGMPLLLADVVAIFISIYASFLVVDGLLASVTMSPLLPAVRGSCILVLIMMVQRSYPGCNLNPVIELKNCIIATIACFSVLALMRYTALSDPGNLLFMIGSFCLALFVVPSVKSLTRSLFSRFGWWGVRAIVFANPDGESDFELLNRNRKSGLKPIGVIGEPYASWHNNSTNFLGVPAESAEIANEYQAYWAIVSRNEGHEASEELQQAVNEQLLHFPHVFVLSNEDSLPGLWSQPFDMNGVQGTQITSKLTLGLPRIVKRASDLVAVLGLAIPILTVVGILALAIKLTSPGPVFYAHLRLGRNGKRFRAWKLRTMHVNADQLLAKYLASDPDLQQEWEATQKLKNDPRVNSIGRFLRATSLDELPQIWNVLRGEMSLVGPRPIVDDEIDKYCKTYELYSRVTPGVTGLWQISGRNHTTYEDRVAFDAYYVRNWSLWLDLYILIRTFKVVLTREGAY